MRERWETHLANPLCLKKRYFPMCWLWLMVSEKKAPAMVQIRMCPPPKLQANVPNVHEKNCNFFIWNTYRFLSSILLRVLIFAQPPPPQIINSPTATSPASSVHPPPSSPSKLSRYFPLDQIHPATPPPPLLTASLFSRLCTVQSIPHSHMPALHTRQRLSNPFLYHTPLIFEL